MCAFLRVDRVSSCLEGILLVLSQGTQYPSIMGQLIQPPDPS